MEKETTKRKVIFNRASKREKHFSPKLTLPVGMVKALGVTEEDREVTLECDGEKIVITKTKKIGRGAARFFLGKYDAEPYKDPTTPKNLADRAAKLEHECKSNEKLLTKKNHAIYTVCASSLLTFFYPFFRICGVSQI